ncbi:glycosyltransferase family 2 protein [Patescibacteria group bacterium]|nr:glycosyltransferase family 2 protein [Patescibacteria group bacterium]
MKKNISVVINTLNEEKNIARAVKSVQSFATEVIVCDMYSTDQTVEIAKRLGAKVFFHKKTGFVEPARNFAISKAKGEWILILDADEVLPNVLAKRLEEMLNKPILSSFVSIPRKNIIFGKWMKAAMWWPDYNIRFFKKGEVIWNNQIHSNPTTQAQGLTLPAEEDLAIIHYNYTNIEQYIARLNRYTTIQAQELAGEKIVFNWTTLFSKPVEEFLSRYFANKGYQDGLHGLALSLLQAFSFVVVYLKLWEIYKFREEEISVEQVNQEMKQIAHDFRYWLRLVRAPNGPIKKFVYKLRNRLSYE